MKILMIGWGFPPKIQGGLDIHVYEISRELAKRAEVLLALPEFNSPKRDSEGIKIIPVRCPKASAGSLVKTVSWYGKNAAEACRNLDFDVIHSHDWFGVEAAEILKQKTGKPWVFTLHSLEFMRSCEQGGKSIMERQERRGAEKCDKVLTVSRLMRKEIAERYGGKAEKIDVVYNSAKEQEGEPGKIRKKLGLGERPVALFLGRLSNQKGPEYFLRSAKIVLDKIPEARFLVAGEGHMREGLEKFSKHMGLEGKVAFTGFVPESDLASYYAAADVFALPSLHEPFGITALESLLAGTPVIVSEGAGALERLPEMDCVYKIRPGDSGDLAEKMVSGLSRRRRVSEREREAVKKAYSWERSAAEIFELYQKMI